MLEDRTTVRGDSAESAFLAAGGADFHVPRAGSPSRSLSFIAAAGDDLAGRHGTTTTTDWGQLSTEECRAAVDDEGIEGEFETAHIFDADDTASREIIQYYTDSKNPYYKNAG